MTGKEIKKKKHYKRGLMLQGWPALERPIRLPPEKIIIKS